MRGENCIEASVNDISNIAKTIDTTVMVEVAILLKMICATWGSLLEGKNASGIQEPKAGYVASRYDSSHPMKPSAIVMHSGLTRNPPRRL